MAMLNKETFREAQPSELSLFELPPTQTAVEGIKYEQYRPIAQLSGLSPIEFNISGNGMQFMDLHKSRLHLKVKIRNADGTKLAENIKTAPVNLLFHSLFNQVDVYLSGKLVSTNSTNYPFKAIISTLLQYGKDASDTQLSAQMFEMDTGGALNEKEPKGRNAGLYKRHKYIAESRSVDLCGPLLHDLFSMDRYLLNQVDVQLRLYRTKPSFCLISAEETPDYDVSIEDIFLEICKIKVNPAVIYGQAQILKTVNAKYPYTKTEVKLMTISTGQVSFVWDNIFQGISPSRVVLGFVSSRAVAGSYEHNPFNFQHFNLQQLSLLCDGVPVMGSGPMKLNFQTTANQTFKDVTLRQHV